MRFAATNACLYQKNNCYLFRSKYRLCEISEGYNNIVLNVNVPILDQLRQSGTVMDL
jgi:hypothetical protein